MKPSVLSWCNHTLEFANLLVSYYYDYRDRWKSYNRWLIFFFGNCVVRLAPTDGFSASFDRNLFCWSISATRLLSTSVLVNGQYHFGGQKEKYSVSSCKILFEELQKSRIRMRYYIRSLVLMCLNWKSRTKCFKRRKVFFLCTFSQQNHSNYEHC